MGVISGIVDVVFGLNRNVLKETIEVFHENAEAAANRDHDRHAAALLQFAQEFQQPKRARFDRFMDGLNRLPRPFMALGCIGLLGAAMYDPLWFASRMQGLALVPEPLWWLLGGVVSFYFGARHQAKGYEFQSSIARTLSQTANVVESVEQIKAMNTDAVAQSAQENAALKDWRRLQG